VTDDLDPFASPAPEEVPLGRSPVVRVIAQVRFPPELSVERPDVTEEIQNDLKQSYPVLRQEQAQAVVQGPNGQPTMAVFPVWRFFDRENKWRVSLARDFIAIETAKYDGRAEFLSRLREAVALLDHHVGPEVVDRFGVRYVHRLAGDDLAELRRFVRPELLGVLASPVAGHVLHAIGEALFQVDKTHLVARWGRLPPGASFDPGLLAPLAVPSWFLDVDAARPGPSPFEVERVMSDAERHAERIYALFRWAVTDALIAHLEQPAH
jgi:uncharacterized protein (TIGR04255 family)